MTISIDPNVTTNASGTFNVQSVGLIQGTAYPDPASRFYLAGGLLASAETLPMWGGVGIFENIPNGAAALAPRVELGSYVGRATALTGSKALNGFSVFDQAYGMINSPQSPVPLASGGGQVMYYRLGSRARIAVACAPGLISLRGGPVGAQVSWDYAAQQLVPYAPAYNAVTITGAVWANTSGGQTTFTVGTDLTAVLAAGSVIDVSGVVNTGGTSTGAFNGNWVVVSLDATHVVVTQAASVSPGTYASGGTIAAGGGALNVEVLDVQQTNCMTVSYNAVTNLATWNYNGSAAVILI